MPERPIVSPQEILHAPRKGGEHRGQQEDEQPDLTDAAAQIEEDGHRNEEDRPR